MHNGAVMSCTVFIMLTVAVFLLINGVSSQI